MGRGLYQQANNQSTYGIVSYFYVRPSECTIPFIKTQYKAQKLCTLHLNSIPETIDTDVVEQLVQVL